MKLFGVSAATLDRRFSKLLKGSHFVYGVGRKRQIENLFFRRLIFGIESNFICSKQKKNQKKNPELQTSPEPRPAEFVPMGEI
jgi:hypothetical protein